MSELLAIRMQDLVVPIFDMSEAPAEPNGEPATRIEFRGTGSIIGAGALVLTADHVIRNCQGQLVVHFHTSNEWRKITLFESDREHDLAVLSLLGAPATHTLEPLFGREFPSNLDLTTLEYSTTTTALDSGGTPRFSVNPATRRGHITRYVNLVDLYGAAGESMLELSFPALEGASGAPVMIDRQLNVIGVLVANQDHHLIPVQTLTALTNDNKMLEEVRYMLPQGLAVDINHLRPIYERARHAATAGQQRGPAHSPPQ
jgi:hypothetical protein